MSLPEGPRAAPPFRFRPAVEADFEALLDLSIRTLRPHLERIGRWDPARRRACARAAFDAVPFRMIEVKGALAGCIGVLRHPDHVEVNGFFLEPAWQNRGLGAAVMRAVMAEAPEWPVRLEVLKHSPAARFYERLGFARIAEQDYDWLYALPARTA